MVKDGHAGWVKENVNILQKINYTNGYLKEMPESTGTKIVLHCQIDVIDWKIIGRVVNRKPQL